MAITSTTTDYSGRNRDLFISQGLQFSKPGVQPVNYNFGSPSAYVAGVQKLVQRYAILLFNTGFLSQLKLASAFNVQEATHIFNFANWDVTKQLRAFQSANPDLPEDEQLSAAQLQEVLVNKDRLSFSVKIVTRAGENIPFVLPIPLQ